MGRSSNQTARTSLSAREIKNLLGVREVDGDLYINSTSFGRIADTNTDARVVQLSLKLDF